MKEPTPYEMCEYIARFASNQDAPLAERAQHILDTHPLEDIIGYYNAIQDTVAEVLGEDRQDHQED